MMSYRLQIEIKKLVEKFTQMADKVDRIISFTIESVKTIDVEKAQIVITLDKEIDTLEVEFEEECLKTLALYQPVATDLRSIVALLKINNDLERISDLASNIAKRVIYLSDHSAPAWPFDIETMTSLMFLMYRNTMNALPEFDTEAAYTVLKRDNEVDMIHRQMYKSLANVIKKSSNNEIDALIAMSSISRYIERIADHLTNIAEDIIYVNNGSIVRHQKT